MKSKQLATVLMWVFMMWEIICVGADKGCNCSGYGLVEPDTNGPREMKYCVDNLVNFGWRETTFMDVINAGNNTLEPILKFIGRWATCSLMETMAKKIPIIQTCPSNFTGDVVIRNKCEVENLSIPPVDYNGVLKVTFKNIFCARCHGIDEDLMVNVNSWISGITCSRKINSVNDTSTCNFQYDPPPSKINICSMGRLEEISRKSMWRQCKLNDTEACLLVHFLKYDLVEFASVCEGNTDIGTDLTTLFRFQTQNLDKLKLNGILIKGSSICKEDENFDQYLQACRQFVCPPSYYPKLGQCQNNLTIYLNADTQPFPDGTNLVSLNINIKLVTVVLIDLIGEVLSKLRNVYPNQWMKNISHYSISWKLKSIYVSFNITETFLEEFINILSGLEFPVSKGTITEFRITNNISTYKASCPIESDELRCTEKVELDFQKDTIFASRATEGKTVLIALENTYFDLKIIHPESTMEIMSVCYCVPPPEKSKVTCLTQLYKFTENEYKINYLDGSLEMVSTGIKIANSFFYLDNNGTAFVCFESLATSFRPFLNYDATLSYISWACSLMSVAFQLKTLILFTLFSELRNLSSKITAGLSVSMILGQIGLHIPKGNLEFCQSIAAVTHFSWLSAFSWMTSQAVNMFVTFHPKTYSKATAWHDGNAFRKYALFSLMIPLVIVCLFLTLDMIPGEHIHSGYGRATCGWFSNQSSYMYGFFVPVGISVLLNIILFSLTLYHIEKTLSSTTKVTGKARNRNMCMIYIKLTSVMGLSWVFGFIASVANSSGLWYVYVVLNGLQGLFVFISFSMNGRVRHLIRSKFKGLGFESRTKTKESTVVA